jgi:dihydroneopterin aldolase
MAKIVNSVKGVTKTIELSNLQLLLYIGVHRHERQSLQKLLVSLSVRINENGESDDICKTLDYDQIYHYLKDLEKSDHFDLQETVCAGY